MLQHCFHFLEHVGPLFHHEVVPVHTHACIVVITQTPSFAIHNWLHRHCVPTSFHENFVAQKLLPQTYRFPRAVISFDQQPHDSTVWLGFCVVGWRISCLPCHRAKQLDARVVTAMGNAYAASPLHTATPTPGPWTSSRQFGLALLLALSQCCVSVSGETWRQRRVVHVGGMLSKTLCSVVVGASETQWSEDWQRREVPRFRWKMM